MPFSKPIMQIRPTKFKLEDYKSKIDEISTVFSNYLGNFRPKTASYSKHSRMGPIGKLISQMKALITYDAQALKGYTLRIHETSGRYAPRGSDIEALGKGIDKLIELMDSVPRIRRPFILSLIDDKVYYAIRKDEILYLHSLRQEYLTWGEKRFDSRKKFLSAIGAKSEQNIRAPTVSRLGRLSKEDAEYPILKEFREAMQEKLEEDEYLAETMEGVI